MASFIVVNVEGKKIIGEKRASDLVVRVGVQLSYVVDVDRESVDEKMFPWPIPVSILKNSDTLVFTITKNLRRRNKLVIHLHSFLGKFSFCSLKISPLYQTIIVTTEIFDNLVVIPGRVCYY